VRLTTAEAIVRYLIAQRTVIDGEEVALFPGVYAIFGHGNVTCLGHSLEQHRDEMPTWRGQNEQGMALAATAFAKASKRRRIMVATSSIGPGATNMVTAAGVAMANRLPLLLIAGDTFQSRVPDPVLQQVEHFGEPSTTVNDAFRPVVRYWDRITHPAQVVQSLPHAVHTMLDPGDCGPAFIGLPQDVAGEAYDYPRRFFERRVHEPRRPRPDAGELAAAAAALTSAEKPLIIAGGGVHWSEAEAELRTFAERHDIPVVETVAGRTSLPQSHPLHAGTIGVTGCTSANALAAEADVVLAVGTRLQDFATGSWTVFRNEAVRIVGLNTARFDATKHLALPLVADAREALTELSAAVGDYRSADGWSATCASEVAQYHAYIDKIAAPDASADSGLPTYAQVVGVVDRLAGPDTYALTAAGGFPGELVNGWRSDTVHSFDAEYGFSCMGYEIAGAWGAKMAMPEREVVSFVGDGSYLMMNSDLYSSVLSGHKLIVIVCDNGGYAVINRLQINQGGVPFNNLIADARIVEEVRVDFAAHAAAMGCHAETVSTVAELEAAFERARLTDRTSVIALRTDAYSWTEGGSFWEVGVPEVSDRAEVLAARAEVDAGKTNQRVGW
ncbi:MAG: 3D-(3,5/4)-trihydroxycyclohexane-1,2-dione acylhydrolase (decyclizing), partial [Ilumatobacter sp.]|nr:3D-(3,5/4)-trihydroxycyclohexane-1,2-dione acylhydrolase (decyclizing) [Ilumatobacter sp.]